MKKYPCANCGVINKIPDDVSLAQVRCQSCSQPLTNARDAKETGDMSTAVGLMGGGMLGASIAGFPGAFVGALLGALIGREAREVG